MIENAKVRALKMIETCTEPEKLRTLIRNARKQGEEEIAHAATLRLYEVLPCEKPGTFEHDVWRSIHALEGTLTEERGKTTRLGRTRPKIARVGEQETVRDLILADKPSEGFHMLIDRHLSHLTFEAVALRHQDRFEEHVLDAAVRRLNSVDIAASR
ncbi:hypothetical protein [Mesorhizobium sp. M0041]|uniref:hypothetical protein n=1 Tax=Mesorhizobium sp. M0041 TaxID=2956856 RepID=UPI00333A3820